MLDRNGRIVVVLISILIAIGAFLLLSGGDDEETAATPTPAATPAVEPTGASTPAATEEATAEASPVGEPPILINNGEVVGGVREITVKQGEDVKFSVASDTADEVHIHGYDIKKDLEAGSPGEFSFKADITGIFEIELEGAKLQIASLRVEP